MSLFKEGDHALMLITLGQFGAGTEVCLAEYFPKGGLVRSAATGRLFRACEAGWICERDGQTLAIGERNLMPLRGPFASYGQREQEMSPC